MKTLKRDANVAGDVMRKLLTKYLPLSLAFVLCVNGRAAPPSTNVAAAVNNDTGAASSANTVSPASSSSSNAPSDANAAAPSASGVVATTTSDASAPSEISPAVAAAANWPQWRGPNRDGQVSDFVAPASAWPKELKEQWRVTVGVGHSSPVAADGKIYVHARQGEEEVLLALDAATGKEIWRAAQGATPYEMNSAALDHGKGPKSTPVVSGGHVYTLGITGVLSCHDARAGKMKWRKDFSKQFPTTSPLFGTAMSPIVDGKVVIAHVGGHDKGMLAAFDAATGALKWSYDADGPGYSSPVIATLAGARQLVTFTQKELVGVDVTNGKLLWKLPSKTQYDTNCNTPVVYKDTLVFSREGRGLEAVRVVKRGAEFAAQEVWQNTEHEQSMSSPVVRGKTLFGMSIKKKGQFFAVDADTGKTVWASPGRMGENAAILNAGNFLLLLTNDANLIVLNANAKEYAPAAQYTVAKSPTWAHPLVAGNRLLVKDETTLASLALY